MKTTLVMAMSLLLLAGCVTETTGGFNAKKSNADAMDDYLKLAAGYLEQNDLATTRKHLANAARIDPDNSEMHAIWGLVYAREGENTLADRSFQQSLRRNPANSKARNNYAAFLFSSGRYADAYQQLMKVVEDTQYESRPQAFENLGLAAVRLNRTKEAEDAFTRALQLNPSQARSTLELTALNLAKPDAKQAQAMYRRFQTLQQVYNIPHNARSLWLGVQVELAVGNKNAARNYGNLLQTNFASAPETQLYKQLADNIK